MVLFRLLRLFRLVGVSHSVTLSAPRDSNSHAQPAHPPPSLEMASNRPAKRARLSTGNDEDDVEKELSLLADSNENGVPQEELEDDEEEGFTEKPTQVSDLYLDTARSPLS